MEGTAPSSRPVTLQTTEAVAANGDGHGSTASTAPLASLHSIRKPPAKPWKKPAALPVPPKVYRVDPRGFRQLVQRLTGANEPAPRRLQEAAPVPIALPTPPCAFPPQPTPPAPPAQAYVQYGGASPPSSSSTSPELPLGYSAPGEAAAATATADAPPVDDNASYLQSQGYTAGISSPSLYSACLAWCSVPLLSPGSVACFEQSTVP